MSELKRCPFYGGDNVGVWHNRPVSPLAEDSYEVHCWDCHFSLYPTGEREEAIKAWNTRKPMQNIVERLEHFNEETFYRANGRANGKTLAYGYSQGIYKAIEIVKEEGGIE